MPGKSKLTADAAEQVALRGLSKSEQRGEADRARAIPLTLEGRKAAEVAGLRSGRQAKIGPHAGAIAAAIPDEDVRYNGGWTLVRLCAEIARRGGPAISPRWLSHQLRQRGLSGAGHVTPSKGARTQRRPRRAASALPI